MQVFGVLLFPGYEISSKTQLIGKTLKIIGHKLKKKQYVGSLINTVKGYKLSLFSVLFLSTVSLHICLQPNTLEDNVFSIVKETSIQYFKYNKYIIHRHKLNTCTNPRQT